MSTCSNNAILAIQAIAKLMQNPNNKIFGKKAFLGLILIYIF